MRGRCVDRRLFTALRQSWLRPGAAGGLRPGPARWGGGRWAAAAATPEGEPWHERHRTALIATAAAAPLVALAAYGVYDGSLLGGGTKVEVNIKPISEEVFDLSDNLFVFFLEKAEDLLERREEIQGIIRTFVSEESMRRVKYYYNVRKDDDPPVPQGDGEEEGAGGKAALRVIMYKGQRKAVVRMGQEPPKKKVLDFFAAVSEALPESARTLGVPRVSGATFEEDVLVASGTVPVLLQLYEDTCFLCFLMRPFVNSIAKLLEEQKVSVKIKRLNIEKNDFPDYCPVARGTPTFVLFGAGPAPDKWEEFKPKDLVEKLGKQFPQLPESVLAEMEELQTHVSRRFQLFTQLVMWTMELQKLEALVAESGTLLAGGKPTAPAQAGDKEDESGFQENVSQMMAEDLRRTDCLAENIQHLQKEVDEVEHDAALMGAMLAEAVIRRERAEASG